MAPTFIWYFDIEYFGIELLSGSHFFDIQSNYVAPTYNLLFLVFILMLIQKVAPTKLLQAIIIFIEHL